MESISTAMGKRSSFPRIDRDLYPTPRRAVVPLIPHLRASGIETFAEPCAGNGDLAQHLEGFGLRCVYRGDVATGQDARLLTLTDCNGADAIITNPPHTRALMHEMITRFVSIGLPTWLLIDLDWVANLQATTFLPRCSDVVIVGRVQWFPDSEHSSKENFGWYRFDASHRGPTAIRNERQGAHL
jgi:hypothetical protein